ncbi:hypothetical protein ACGFIY_21625 [Micromonospora chersina]|uniref:hypothetical protein n=1 Tax=Micromonospora chersina TaxID=47854 RepID=UPI003715E5DA
MTTVADLLEGLPVWAAPARNLCTYCASPGRQHVQLLPPAPPSGCCRVCGEEVEPLTCQPGVDCEPVHTDCPDCPVVAETCTSCQGCATAGCVFCHGTGLELPNHCCTCHAFGGDCACPVIVATLVEPPAGQEEWA